MCVYVMKFRFYRSHYNTYVTPTPPGICWPSRAAAWEWQPPHGRLQPELGARNFQEFAWKMWNFQDVSGDSEILNVEPLIIVTAVVISHTALDAK